MCSFFTMWRILYFSTFFIGLMDARPPENYREPPYYHHTEPSYNHGKPPYHHEEPIYPYHRRRPLQYHHEPFYHHRESSHHYYNPQPYREITFPIVEQYDECYVNAEHTQKGTCKRLSQCPKAVDRWHYEKIRPETCYFEKFEQFVCCEIDQDNVFEIGPRSDEEDMEQEKDQNKQQSSNGVRIRRSEMACTRNSGVDERLVPAVVNGIPTVYNEFPFMAALGWKANYGADISYLCGGALIDPKFVLTAAHCAVHGGETPDVVRIGGTNLTDNDITDIVITRIIVHPDYNASLMYNDIALVELEKNALEVPACLSHHHDLTTKEVITIGYGHTKFAGAPSSQLLKAKLGIVSNKDCNYYYNDTLSMGILSTQMCAKDSDNLRDTCQGDSGGPIVIRTNEQFQSHSYVLGITSFGVGCANTPPSVYTRVSAYIDWIEEIVWPVRK